MRKKIFLGILAVLILAAGFWFFFQDRKPAVKMKAESGRPAARSQKAKENEHSAPEELEALRALPYLQYTSKSVDPKRKGVTVYDKQRAYPGLNLYVHHTQIRLVDMTGKVFHTWYAPDKQRAEYAILLDGGDVIVIFHHRGLARLDWNSKVVWQKYVIAHHDVAPAADGSFFFPVRQATREYNSYKVTFDTISRMNPSGEIKDYWSTWDQLSSIKALHHPLVLETFSAEEAAKGWNKKIRYSYYHVNTVSLLPDTPLGKKDRRFRPGNLMVCLRNASLIVILDQETKKAVWSWGPGILDFPHMPSMTHQGTVIVFDNGMFRKYTRILEVEPVSGKILWEYKGNPPEDFYSSRQGACQRLPNGNTLICDSEKGRAFELDPSGRMVWEFWNPEIRKTKRSTLYRFLRYYSSENQDDSLFTFSHLPKEFVR